MKDPRAKVPKTRASTQTLFFQNPRAKKLSQTENLEDRSSFYNKLFTHFKKIDKTFNKKFLKEKREQYHLKRARNSGI